jgi:hypothetical protein
MAQLRSTAMAGAALGLVMGVSDGAGCGQKVPMLPISQ